METKEAKIILGKKLAMSHFFSGDDAIPVTLVKIKESNIDFEAGKEVKIVGKTKGRGFQGVVKRHGFHGGPKTHGQKNCLRAPGSIGPTAPQRVIPGRRMAGRMGNDRKTIKNIPIVNWDKERGLLSLKGPLPGTRGSQIRIFYS